MLNGCLELLPIPLASATTYIHTAPVSDVCVSINLFTGFFERRLLNGVLLTELSDPVEEEFNLALL